MNSTFDTIVVGAGPAGCTAARFLAMAGMRVLLIEKDKLPRYKVCGGGLVWRARQALELPLDEVIEREFNDVKWKFSKEMSFTVKRNYPLISMVMRDRFDAYLTRVASEAGADIHDQESFESFRSDKGHIIVKTNLSVYRANYLLAADGLRSRVLRQLKWKDKRLKVPAIEAEVHVDALERYKDVTFDVSATRHGYGWIFPKKDHLSVGIAAMPGKGISLRSVYNTYLNHSGLRSHLVDEQRFGYQIPLQPHSKLHDGNVLLLGDAAGLADPLVAEGISHAIFSGKFAATALTSSPDNGGQRYEELVRQNLYGQIRAARIFAVLFYEHPDLCTRILRSKGAYISEYVSDIFAGDRMYPHNWKMLLKSVKRLII